MRHIAALEATVGADDPTTRITLLHIAPPPIPCLLPQTLGSRSGPNATAPPAAHPRENFPAAHAQTQGRKLTLSLRTEEIATHEADQGPNSVVITRQQPPPPNPPPRFVCVRLLRSLLRIPPLSSVPSWLAAEMRRKPRRVLCEKRREEKEKWSRLRLGYATTCLRAVMLIVAKTR